MEVYIVVSVVGIVMMLAILHVDGIGKHAHHVNTGLKIQNIVMIVPLGKVNGRMDMSTETVIIFICGMFAGVLMEFIISAVVIMKGEKNNDR